MSLLQNFRCQIPTPEKGVIGSKEIEAANRVVENGRETSHSTIRETIFDIANNKSHVLILL